MASERWVYGFEDLSTAEKDAGGTWDSVRGLLGGKGANLADMSRLGVPVPPGFIITTRACNAYLAAKGKAPPELWKQVDQALARLEEQSGRQFGNADKPLLVSCRSGAKLSMPGMMDTVLNIGLNEDVVRGLASSNDSERFAYDSQRRLIQMFGSVVLGLRDELFEDILSGYRKRRSVTADTGLSAQDLQEVVADFSALVPAFPSSPKEQLRMAIEAVFRSWGGKRAVDYRNASGIAHDLGTAVNIQCMVFGNLGDDSATGVCMSRSATSGENVLEGDYLINAQGEDVVAGIRATKPIAELGKDMPAMYEQLRETAKKLEAHHRDMQDMEFTIERGKLWLLQTRDGKRTAQAAVRIAVDMAEAGLISREKALLRVRPEHIDFFLHPQLTVEARASAVKLASGLNVSPGAAVGVVAFDADLTETWVKQEKKQVIMVRPETKPDDVHGMLAAEGIVTSRGGRTSHAALVARQFGKPAVVGIDALVVDLHARTMSVGDRVVREGEWISVDGTSGEVFLGKLDTIIPNLEDPFLAKLLTWADGVRRLGVRANADYPVDAARARAYGAEGLGLVRTEHMFFQAERLPIMQRMILAESAPERQAALLELLPFQRADFAGLFRVMRDLPVIIRLIDPPLHEFLPNHDALSAALTDHKIRLSHASNLEELDRLLAQVTSEQRMLKRVEVLREANPMLGTRGVRLGILFPELTRMQVRAIFEAACDVSKEGIVVRPEVMIPLTCHANELASQRRLLESEAKAVLEERKAKIEYSFGTMIEIPRAALTASELAKHAEFFSFGTNDLTQTTYGISRDDAERGFLVRYLQEGILAENPFAHIDPEGVGRLMRIAVEEGRAARPALRVGICGEHGGDPASIALCHELGLDYVSCSPFRVPVARLAAAHAALRATHH